MTKLQAIKTYFGQEKPVTNSELVALRRADAKSFDEIAAECLRALGETEG